jgi:peroxiredoxin
MDRSLAPEFRGNIGGCLVLPSTRVGTIAFAIAIALFQASPSDAVPKIFTPITAAKCPTMFTLPDVDGHARALGGEKGKPVVLHFFATWCEPCKAEFGTLQKFYKVRSDELDVLAISVGEVPGRVRSFLKETPVSFPVLLDADRSVTKSWAVEGLPTTIVLDKSLKPILSVNGDLDWTRADIAREIEDTLANSPNSKHADCTKEDIP